MTQKRIALYYYVKVVFKNNPINMSQIKISRPFRTPLKNEKTYYKHIFVLHLIFSSLLFLILYSSNIIHNKNLHPICLQDLHNAFILKS